MAIDFSGKSWATKTIPNYTDAMDVYEDARPDGNPDVRTSLWREWERRHGLDQVGG